MFSNESNQLVLILSREKIVVCDIGNLFSSMFW